MSRAVLRSRRGGLLAAAGASGAAIALYALWRPWQRHWGATAADAQSPLPGDSLISRPRYLTTRAVTIGAPPHVVWPWLAELGYRRGNAIPIGAGPSWPVLLAKPNRTLLLHAQHDDVGVTWVFALFPSGAGDTRLVTRVRVQTRRTPARRLQLLMLEPTEFFIVRRILLDLKTRAARLARHI